MSEPAPRNEWMEQGGVRFSDKEVAELDRDRPVLRIPRDRVREIRLERGFQAARPLVQPVLGGSILAATLWWGGGVIVHWLRYGGVLEAEFIVGVVTMSLLGGWLALHGLRRGLYLAVQTDSRLEKLQLHRNLSREEVETFLSEVRRTLGYPIVDSALHRAGLCNSPSVPILQPFSYLALRAAVTGCLQYVPIQRRLP